MEIRFQPPKTDTQEIREVFRIANNYRDSHAFPMRQVRFELQSLMRRKKIRGMAPVARLKRMPSIRRKLRAISANLNQIQDLAGCRVIADDMEHASALIEALRIDGKHSLFREFPYIVEPKIDGYRSHHMVFKFRPAAPGEEPYTDRRVEVQVRTRLQHSWATGVEAVGLFRGEDMKAGQGDPDWLRLFFLMSQEFQLAEGCAIADDAPARRLEEIADLERKLGAVLYMEDMRQGVKITEDYRFDPNNKPEYFLIRYNRNNRTVSFEPQFSPNLAMASYDRAEYQNSREGRGQINSVLVEVDEIANLKSAYPNYFGDVNIFMHHLMRAAGHDPESFNLEPQTKYRRQKPERGDLSWLRGGYKRW